MDHNVNACWYYRLLAARDSYAAIDMGEPR